MKEAFKHKGGIHLSRRILKGTYVFNNNPCANYGKGNVFLIICDKEMKNCKVISNQLFKQF